MVFDFAWSNTNLFYNQYTRIRCFFENSPDLTQVEPPTGKLKEYLAGLREKYGVLNVSKMALRNRFRRRAKARAPPENLRQAGLLLDSVGWVMAPDGIRRRDGQKLSFELLLYEHT